MQLVSSSREPLQLQTFTQALHSPTTSAFEQTLAHGVPWNGRPGSDVQLSDPTLEFASPDGVRVIVHILVEAGEQGLREGRAIVHRHSQRLFQERGDVAFH